MKVIQRFGAKAGCQLGHGGRQHGFPDLPAIAPSPVSFTPESRVPEELTKEGIRDVVEAFRQSARCARKAGFDTLEVHTAHGYLLNEFLSALANPRTDEYGGNHENHYRIVREVVDAIREEWKGPLFVRISSTDYAEGGNTPKVFPVVPPRVEYSLTQEGRTLYDLIMGLSKWGKTWLDNRGMSTAADENITQLRSGG